MRIRNFTSEEALEKLEELLKYEIPDYAGKRHYEEICDVVGMDYYDWPDDFIDEELLIDRVKQHLDDWWLSAAKNMLTDIDLNDGLWIIDGNGRPRDIDSADCTYLKNEIMKELEDMLDEEDMEKYKDMCERYENSD